MSNQYSSPWRQGWRKSAREKFDQKWDIIVIGGGITGAGILAVSARSGMRVLLLEQGDFASGTSSRSSKLVHGGLRYLKHMQIKLTRESVRERQRMLHAAPGLVEPLGFIYPMYEGDKPSPWLMAVGLGIYTRLSPDAGDYKRLDSVDIGMLAPGLMMRKLEQGYHYVDAKTDDARLVLRVLHDGLLAGEGRCAALNYCRATGLLLENDRVVGVRVRDEMTGERAEARAILVINATGAWADRLRSEVGGTPRLRPIRGSHLFFSHSRFPIYQSIAFTHPDDRRPVFAFPWEGITLLGTTDIDHSLSLDIEPAISLEEAEYLLRAAQAYFPELELTLKDVLSTQAGVRPVVDTGKKDPSAESRDHVVWNENELLTVTGGKLTTFRIIALDALKEAHEMKMELPEPDSRTNVFDSLKPDLSIAGIDSSEALRLYGRYGAAAPEVVNAAPEMRKLVKGTRCLWAELAWAMRNEAVCHLDDFMLRRFRFGILLRDGGQSLLLSLKPMFKDNLGWDERRWEEEVERYLNIWKTGYSLPSDWQYGIKHRE